jgi:hypothetical protein
MNNITTTDLSEFGMREIIEANKLLTAWVNNGLPNDFYDDGVTIMMNKNSGNVFLANSEYQVAMEDGGKLYSFYSTPYNGIEGSYEDLMADYENMSNEDKEYMDQLTANRKGGINVR